MDANEEFQIIEPPIYDEFKLGYGNYYESSRIASASFTNISYRLT